MEESEDVKSERCGPTITAELGTAQTKSRVPTIQNAPLVVYPFGEEPFADISSKPRIEWAPDLEEKARCSLERECDAESCRQAAQSLSILFGRVAISLILSGIVGAAPRCIALASSRAAASVPLEQDTASNFMELWATCNVRDKAYSGFDKHGQFFKVLVGSDHFFNHVGLSMATSTAHHATFPTQTTRAGRLLMLLFSGTAGLSAVTMFWTAVGLMNEDELTAEEWRNTIMGHYALVVMLLFVAGQLTLAGHSRSTSGETRIGNRNVLGSFRNRLKVIGVAMVILFYARVVGNSIFGLPPFMYVLAGWFGWHSAWTFLLPLVVNKCLLSLLGLVYGWDETVGFLPQCMLAFVSHAFTSMAVRSSTYDLAGDDLLQIFYKAAGMLAMDAAAHGCAHAYIRHAERRIQRAQGKDLATEPRLPSFTSNAPAAADASDARARPTQAARHQGAAAAPERDRDVNLDEDEITPAPSTDVRIALANSPVSGGTPPAMVCSPAVHKQSLAVERLRERVTEGLIIQLLADLFCSTALAGQLVAAPDYVQWSSLAMLSGQPARALTALALQVVVLVAGHWLVVLAAYRQMPGLYRRCFDKLWQSVKLRLFCLGLMIQFSLYFWPKCMSCSHPKNCLLYLECASTGEVLVEGDNWCAHNTTGQVAINTSRVVEIMSRKLPGLSHEWLGCNRTGVYC